jgi:hypothetical protein
MMTKAERLAGYLENAESMSHARITMSESAAELRRLSPMEAENAALKAANKDCVLHFDTLKADYDKLLAVNKVLVDSSKALINRYTSLVNCGDCGNWDPEDDDEVIAMRESIELAGGIK